MKPEEQRIAIAEALWLPEAYWWCPRCQCQVDPQMVTFDEIHDTEGCVTAVEWHRPDFLNDLNAMHEAEKSLTIDQTASYLAHLCSVTGGALHHHGDFTLGALVVRATSSQRAEAFLKTLNLWKP